MVDDFWKIYVVGIWISVDPLRNKLSCCGDLMNGSDNCKKHLFSTNYEKDFLLNFYDLVSTSCGW